MVGAPTMVKFIAAVVPVSLGGSIKRVLLPDDPVALQRSGDGELVTVEVKHERNIRRHRFYWALCTKVWDNLENELFPTVEDFSDALKIMAGHRSRFWIPPGVPLDDGKVTGPEGMWGFRPLSIAFSKLEEGKFAQFIDRCVALVLKWFLPTVTRAQLLKEIETMCGIKPWWSDEAAR